jgi:hypothetical protein
MSCIYIKNHDGLIIEIIASNQFKSLSVVRLDVDYNTNCKNLDNCDASLMIRTIDNQEFIESFRSKMQLEGRIRNIINVIEG